MPKKKPDYVWRVTRTEDGKVDLSIGPKLSAAGFDDDTKIHLIGKALISLGTQLMGSTTRSEDDDAEWEDES